ncbi:restriction endonuclease subunit S [Pectobacterium brasiliense]|uniref:restriction endonuclease subunit S n=1 Tax=Pectobacterium brasiliense TaxID=180957 RepID=UPI001968B6C2|nr:restriction endonuclease subunit S [Pectobacterium brasiliense]MBN3045004.1 restriction endonuclease subunit S [Pectobacterium brasiliense]
MTFPSYDCFKSIDADWLGRVPSHWEVVRLRYLFKRVKRTNCPEKELLSVYRDYGVIPKNSRDDNHNKPSDDLSPYQLVESGDLVMNKMKAWQGSIAISEYEGIVSPAYFVYSFSGEGRNAIDSKYVHYLLRSPAYITQYMARSKGIRVNQWDLEPDAFEHLEVLLPTIKEQKAIAAFLDRETQRIDSLIEEKQTFIKLLKEKRQALITHVVTKGLNPNVEMQDSGIEWIGRVPKHWNITSLKSVSTVVDPNPSHRNPEYVDNGFPFISTKEFTGIDGIELDTLRRVSEDTVIEQEERCYFREGSIAFSRKGTIGEVRVLPHYIRFALLDSVCVINAGDTMSYQYLYLQAKSSVYDSQLGAVVRGAALKQVSVGKVRDLLTLCPPLDEQNQIVRYIDQQLTKLDKLVVETSRSLALLKERHVALISAAVTGKIDVREAV